MKNFRGRVAVITGAASGIGRALSVALADEGCDLALVDVNEAELTQTAALALRRGVRVSTHPTDVSSREAMQALPDAVQREHGRADIVVNNAGVTVAANLEDQDLDDFEWLVGINVWGVVYGCKFFLPMLRQSDDAYIVNLSSMFGLVGVPGQSSYCLSKFAVRGFSEAIAAELADTNVRVMSVHPGGISTNIVRDARWGDDREGHSRAMRFFETQAMPPEAAAQRIIDGMRRGASRKLITKEAYLTDAVKRLIPVLPASWLARARKAFDAKR
ncbi:MAG: SDR family NAD(P)-dependent oxidoreductase [Nannocystaceae bacterium]|nr:SDR family oxidoreductase [bacterium]